MKFEFIVSCAVMTLASATMVAQFTGDTLGMHDLSCGGKSPISANGDRGCGFCHVPHSGLSATPLWNQTLSKAAYSPYISSTYHEQGNTQPLLGGSTSLCLSCHDGTVAVGQNVVSGKVTMTGSMYPADVFGTNLTGSHPVSLHTPLKDSADLVASLAGSGVTNDSLHAVKLIKGNVECNSSHNPHVENKDLLSSNFLVRDSSNGQMCLACHDPTRTMTGQYNPLCGLVRQRSQPGASRTAAECGTVLPLLHREHGSTLHR